MNWRCLDMKAMSSAINFPFRNGLRVLSQNRKMTIVTCILYLLGIPLLVGGAIWVMLAESHTDPGDPFYYADEDAALIYMAIGGCCLAAAVFMGMFAAINAFTELWSKPKVDMLCSLPLTGTQRFFSNLAGGAGMYLIPYLASAVLGAIMLIAATPLIHYQNIDDLTLGLLLYYYFLAAFGLFLLMLLYYALAALVTVCCGTLFESIYTNILLNLLIPGSMAAILAIIADQNAAFSFEYIWYPIGHMSPIGGLIYLFYMLEELGIDSGSWAYGGRAATQTNVHALLPTYIRWAVVIVILAAVLVLAAWQLYIRRKAEYVGKPFVYIAAYYVMLTLVTVCILCLLSVDVIGPSLLFSAIVYFVMEVIRKRGFKRFWLSAVTYIATVACTVGLFFLLDGTDYFGRARYVPAKGSVSSVHLELKTDARGAGSVDLEYTDRDVIAAVTAYHKELLQARTGRQDDVCIPIDQALTEQRLYSISYSETFGYHLPMPDWYRADGDVRSYPNYDERQDTSGQDYDWFDPNGFYDDEGIWNTKSETFKYADWTIPSDGIGDYSSTTYIELTYYTVTGSVIHRSYAVTDDELYRLQAIVQDTPLYGEAQANGMDRSIDGRFQQWDRTNDCSTIPYEIEFAVHPKDQTSMSLRQTVQVTNAPAELERFKAAYRADMANMTAEKWRTPHTLFSTGDGSYAGEYDIYDCCTETLKVLRDWGIHAFTPTQRIGMMDQGDKTAQTYETGLYQVTGIAIFPAGAYASTSLDYPAATPGMMYYQPQNAAYWDIISGTDPRPLKTRYPELYDLLDALEPTYLTNESCYCVVVNDKPYILPAEKSSLAEAVIRKGANWYYDTQIWQGAVPNAIVPYEQGGTTYGDYQNGYDYGYDEVYEPELAY